MTRSNREYVIPFIGLKLGTHVFDFTITDSFFEAFDYAIIHSGNVKVKFTLEKKETLMIGGFKIKGTVNTTCDRCNDPIEVKVSGDYQLIYKFDTEESEDESLITVFPDEFELDLNDSILEFITVSLPVKKVHKKDECNQEMIKLLEAYATPVSAQELEKQDAEDPMDPRWEALKKLK